MKYRQEQKAVPLFKGRFNPSNGSLTLIEQALHSFQEVTGLPVLLLSNPRPEAPVSFGKQDNEFCRSVWSACQGGCRQCYFVQRDLMGKLGRKLKPHIIRCDAGIIQLAVPIIENGRHVATMLGGKIRIDAPTREELRRVQAQLAECAAPAVGAKLQASYFRTRVISESELASAIHLLNSIAQLIGRCGTDSTRAPRPHDVPLMAGAKAYIREHLADRITTRQIARTLNLSEAYFCRLFKKSTGKTFRAYVAAARIESAKCKLVNSWAPITEICYVSGFQSVSDFNRVFKAKVGASPTAYRKEHAELPR